MTSIPAEAPEWIDLPAVPESQVGGTLRARLVAGEGGPPAPPPWSTQVSAVLWWHRAAPQAVEQLPDAVRGLPHLPITVGALVRYRDSPVGSYSEVFASPVLLRRPGKPRRLRLPAVTVPFIAVDSLASVVGGRAGWMLPKTLARALWPPDGAARIEGDDWSVAAMVNPRGTRFPVRGRLPLLQPHPDGGRRLSTVRLRGQAQLARVQIDTAGPTLPQWLLSGRHPGLAISSGRMEISAPGPES
ncbi:MAG TPA: hypothetical protein VLR26_02035 [Frankiaceae bacterium]|nr:hypothetical protein [Frankiaceae bacterium]